MSDAVTALGGATADGIAQVAEGGLQGMITLRGDLTDHTLKKAATAAAGVDMPGPGHGHHTADGGLCWMSPDELLVLCPYDAVAATLAQMHETLGGTHAMAVDVSDARATFQVSGPAAREVMAKLAPVDLSPEAFAPGMFRRTRLAQVPAAFWMPEPAAFRVVCFRSHAQYVFDLLRTAAAEGSDVGYFGR